MIEHICDLDQQTKSIVTEAMTVPQDDDEVAIRAFVDALLGTFHDAYADARRRLTSLVVNDAAGPNLLNVAAGDLCAFYNPLLELSEELWEVAYHRRRRQEEPGDIQKHQCPTCGGIVYADEPPR